jgi:hypothetical protein
MVTVLLAAVPPQAVTVTFVQLAAPTVGVATEVEYTKPFSVILHPPIALIGTVAVILFTVELTEDKADPTVGGVEQDATGAS